MKKEHNSEFAVELFSHFIHHLLAFTSNKTFPHLRVALQTIIRETDLFTRKIIPLLLSTTLVNGREVICLCLSRYPLKFMH